MRFKLSLMLAAALVSATPAPASAQYTLNVRDADIRAFIQDAARITGRTFVIDGRVNGKVSVVTDRPLSRSEYFERSDERRVGKECGSTCRSRCSPSH